MRFCAIQWQMFPTHHDLVDGKRVRFARAGSGPPIVFLHGYPDTLQIWSNIAARLANNFEVIAFDWPGIGESDAWSGGATPFDLAKRLHDEPQPIGEVFAFLSGLYFRGKLAYATAFGRHDADSAGIYVITANRGLP